jgi:hypothetical protein
MKKLQRVKETRASIIEANNTAGAIEKLSQEELLISLQEREYLWVQGEQRVKEWREQIKFENLARELLAARLKVNNLL